jgi:hypothetical protein
MKEYVKKLLNNGFARFVFEAYAMIENLALYEDATRYAAFIEIENRRWT